MRIYDHLSRFTKLEKAVVTIGTFDGVHSGHRKIINRLTELAAASGGESVLLTFFPHPRMIIDPENQALKMISTLHEKARMLEDMGVDHLIVTPFTRDFSNQTPEEYIREVLVNTIGTKHLIIGYDHHFGKNRSGGIKDLENYKVQYNYQLEEIPELDINEVAVSSTRIRNALLQGDVALANTYLGYTFSLSGQVIKGDKIGRKIGYPTANLFIEENYKLIPGDGIYAVTVEVEKMDGQKSDDRGQKTEDSRQKSEDWRPATEARTSDARPRTYKGMAYIGQRPTINGMTRNIEVNIFDFDKEVYGQDLKMNFHMFLRGDEKFTGLEDLTEQLGKDKISTLSYFESVR